MARYGQQFKDAVVARLLPPESSPVEAVSQKVGISVATLERWRAAALAANDDNGSPRHWTPAARLEAVIATAAMDEATRSAWCREHGLYPTDLDRWKQDALGRLGEPRDDGAAEAKQDQAAKRTDATQSGQPARRRIKELERDLHRKDKALAETAALLVLSKNCRRSSATARTHDPPGRSPSPAARHQGGPRRRRPARLCLCPGQD